MKLFPFFILSLLCLAMTACGGQATSATTPPTDEASTHPAAQAVVSYLQARVEGNADAMRQLTCSAEESKVAQLALSFQGREAQLVDVTCQYDGSGGRAVCTGSISASYQGEARNFPVPNYSVLEEDGTWRVCGEAE
jgi:hypothetical protein